MYLIYIYYYILIYILYIYYNFNMYWQLLTRAPSPRLKLKSPKDESKAPITVPVTIWLTTKGSLPCSFSVSNSFDSRFGMNSLQDHQWPSVTIKMNWMMVSLRSKHRNHLDLIDLTENAAGGTTIFATTDSSISDGVGLQLGDKKKTVWLLGSYSPLQVFLQIGTELVQRVSACFCSLRVLWRDREGVTGSPKVIVSPRWKELNSLEQPCFRSCDSQFLIPAVHTEIVANELHLAWIANVADRYMNHHSWAIKQWSHKLQPIQLRPTIAYPSIYNP